MKKHKTAFLLVAGFALLASSAVPSLAQGIRDSEFTGATLDTFWVFVDPKGNDTLTVGGGFAEIKVPGPMAHEPVAFGQDGNRAPRIIQRITTPGADFGDFDVYAKFDGVQDRQYQMQGILAIQNDKNFVRCEIFSDTGAGGVGADMNFLLYTFDNSGNYADQVTGPIPSLPAGSPFYIRLRRADTLFYQYWSTDGSNWNATNPLGTGHIMNVDSIGVYAANGDSAAFASNTSPSFTGKIDFFKNYIVVPVQLASFTASLQSANRIMLRWMTASETNNFGFELQRSYNSPSNFTTVQNSFIPGHGTTLEPRYYSYVDVAPSSGHWYYRLKQTDLDGTVHFSDPVEVDILTGVSGSGSDIPTAFALEQNYPNPFNPSTVINYDLATEGNVTLEVFNLIGQKVATLINEMKQAGTYSHSFNAAGLTSGVYVYKLTAGGQAFTKKMVLMK